MPLDCTFTITDTRRCSVQSWLFKSILCSQPHDFTFSFEHHRALNCLVHAQLYRPRSPMRELSLVPEVLRQGRLVPKVRLILDLNTTTFMHLSDMISVRGTWSTLPCSYPLDFRQPHFTFVMFFSCSSSRHYAFERSDHFRAKLIGSICSTHNLSGNDQSSLLNGHNSYQLKSLGACSTRNPLHAQVNLG